MDAEKHPQSIQEMSEVIPEEISALSSDAEQWAEKSEVAPAFATDAENGLSSEQVDARIAEGKVNGDQDIKTKSVLQILRENIFTFFNFVFVAMAVILCFCVDLCCSYFSTRR